MGQQVWWQAEAGSLDQFLRDRLVAFWATKPNGETELLGSGFLLLGQDNLALVATAAHVIDHAGHVQAIPDVSEGERNEVGFAPEQFRILWAGGSTVHALACIGLCARSNNSDACLLFATFQAEQGDPISFPDLTYSFDHRLPKVGAEVVVAGQQLKMVRQAVDGDSRRLTVAREIVLRRGTVTDVDPVGRYMGIGPNFTTTIPFPPGFSGSPVFDVGDEGSPMTLRGFVSSSGFPAPGADSDLSISGGGRCASLQSLLPLPVDADGRYQLADLVRRGHYADASGELGFVGIDGEAPRTELRLFPTIE